jgi:FGGY-family pentulose kinase
VSSPDASSLLLGVDVGTGSVRAGLFTAAGRLVGRGEHRIQTWQTRPDHVEQSSDDIWRAACAAVREALTASGARPDSVVGIGFDATCSLVAIDANDRPVGVSLDGRNERNVIVWMDHRAIADAAEINATHHRVLDYVGGVISPEMQTPKLRWVKRELPDTWQRTARWFDLPDYLTWRATGSDDRSLCSTVCKWTYLGHERRWDASYFETIGLGDLTADGFRKIGVRVRVPGERLGGLTSAAAAELGVAVGTPVAASLIDAHAGALGTLGAAGHSAPISRRMAIIAGTSACHLATAPRGTSVPGVWGPYFEALLPNEWLLEAGISASGAFLDHVIRSHPAHLASDTFASLDARLTTLLGRGATEAELTHDLHLQPNVLGNRAPLADPTLRGGVSGWTLRDDPDDLAVWYLAALQSLAYATRHIIEAFAARGRPVDLLIASGGSAANPRWCQTHADALGIPLAIPEEADGVLLGSAMLGGAAAGTHGSIEAAMQAMTRLGRIVAPDPRAADFHDRKYRVYRRMIDDQRVYRDLMAQANAT